MSQPSEVKSDFKFVLNSVRSESVNAVAQELTVLLPLDVPTALNIVKNAPIILIDKLTAHQARSVGSFAIRLKALGADVQVTSQAVGKLQVLRWPLMPDIVKRPGNQVICPNCGVRLQMQVVLTHSGPEQAPQPAQAAPAPAEAPVALAQPAPRPAPAPPPVLPEAEEAILEPLEEEPVDLVEEEVILEEPDGEGPRPAAAPPPTLGQPVGGGGTCRVTLVGKIRGEKKRSAAQFIAYYQGVTEEDAMAQLTKTVVTVAKDLTPEQAEECRSQFARFGVRVTIKG